VNAREFLVVLAATALFLVMAVSFLGNVNWPSSPTSIPVYDPNATSQNGIANQMFEGFAITIILIAILLGAAMIGGFTAGASSDRPNHQIAPAATAAMASAARRERRNTRPMTAS